MQFVFLATVYSGSFRLRTISSARNNLKTHLSFPNKYAKKQPRRSLFLYLTWTRPLLTHDLICPLLTQIMSALIMEENQCLLNLDPWSNSFFRLYRKSSPSMYTLQARKTTLIESSTSLILRALLKSAFTVIHVEELEGSS